MAKPSESLKLHGERAEHFREIREELAERLGHEPSKAQVVGMMMGTFERAEDYEKPPR